MIKLQDIFPADEKPVSKTLTVLLALVAFTLPFKFMVNGFIAAALLVWLFSKPWSNLFTRNRFTPLLIAILFFYVLHALAFIYTTNIGEGFFNLEVKLSMFLFPLIFYSGKYTWPQMKLFLTCFVLGNLLCCLICLVRSAGLSFNGNPGFDPFFYEGLSWFQHPSYLSMYLTFCCIVMLQKKLFSKIVDVLLLVFFTVFVLLLSSKTGIAIHFLFLLMTGVSYFLKKGNYLQVSLFALVSVTALVLVVSFVAPVKERFKNVVNALTSPQIDKTAEESTAVRMLIWHEAAGIIKEKPLRGVGPGDSNDALYDNYRVHGLTGAYKKRLNAHSQYFQTGVGLGFIGLASLLSIFILPFFRKPRRLLVFFLLITAVNFLTESMLQTMAGCIFFGYFYALLSFDKELNPKTTTV